MKAAESWMYDEATNPIVVVLLGVVTFGIYFFYWFYDTNNQFKKKLKNNSSPGLRTLGLFVPIINIIVMWKHANDAERATKGHSGLLVFLAYVVLAPVAWFVIQSDINDVAGRKSKKSSSTSKQKKKGSAKKRS
jgi:hypothetical protein